MGKTLLDVDENFLAKASTALGTTTKTDTEALRRDVEVSRERRRHALESLRHVADEGGFDFDRLR